VCENPKKYQDELQKKSLDLVKALTELTTYVSGSEDSCYYVKNQQMIAVCELVLAVRRWDFIRMELVPSYLKEGYLKEIEAVLDAAADTLSTHMEGGDEEIVPHNWVKDFMGGD
jgi:hypothetical protein